MRLARIVAERFGALRSATLGELGEGLTVVLGPNEAGKTSFTTLVRYVLYGYPTKRDAEPDYGSDAGKRLGRLVFAEDGAQWAVERVEGPHGGPVALSTLAGAPRPDLLDVVTAGISRDAFRVVFGFGLEEMAQIEAGRSAGDDVLSRLYAAKVGLDVSPADVRAALEAQASELWRPAGRNPELNALKAQIAETRRSITGLEVQAAEFSRDREALEALTRALEGAREQRAQTSARAAELTAAVQRVAELDARAAEAEDRSREAALAIAAAREKASRLALDADLEAVAPELEAMLSELSGFKARLARCAQQRAEADAFEARGISALDEVGVSPEMAESMDVGPETQAGVERWRTEIANLESQLTTSRRAAEAARISGDVADAPARTEPRASWVPGILVLAVGVAVLVLGAVTADYVQSLLGALVCGVGAVIAYRVSHPAVPAAGAPHADPAIVRAALAAAESDAAGLDAARARWAEWLEARGLSAAGSDPAAVALLVAGVRQARSHFSEAARLRQSAAQEEQACEEYRASLASLSVGVAPALSACALDEVPVHGARIRELVGAAVTSAREAGEIASHLDDLQLELEQAEAKLKAMREERETRLADLGFVGAVSGMLDAETSSAAQAAREASDSYDEIARDHTALATRLDSEGRESMMARLRLELAGLEQRRDDALDRYTVLSVAERLMARTQAHYEQTRQPEVVRRASELFEQITSGRYVRVSVPADGGPFTVFDPDARPKSSAELSTGTAQQLYLALRIALIETLDHVGAGLPVLMDDVLVNFDPGRKRGAAEAIRHLATHRQVVLFTCHPETAALMELVAPDHTRLTLDRC